MQYLQLQGRTISLLFFSTVALQHLEQSFLQLFVHGRGRIKAHLDKPAYFFFVRRLIRQKNVLPRTRGCTIYCVFWGLEQAPKSGKQACMVTHALLVAFGFINKAEIYHFKIVVATPFFQFPRVHS